MDFQVHDGYTLVTATSQFERTDGSAKEVILDGEELELVNLEMNGRALDQYELKDKSLVFPCFDKDEFSITIVTKIYPEKNTALEGLYRSGDTYCTQCESQGFRRITFFPDRPDILSIFTVRVEADKKFPVLLSNGNKIEDGDTDGGKRSYALWHDPFPKPCYLFALVAGELVHIHDTFKTRSGRSVDLYIYVRPGDEAQCDHAMESLKKSMKWDEDVYGLEYELDIFNIVAVSDFNMGAMENTSLNIFNTALVLAHQETATDSDFIRVESVIAHEYFHNWSGNRVTCRDWFQLSLKEGLTVFRDQEFSSDMNSRPVQRIDDVSHLRRFQFPEDAGPLAHPIRPDNYIEISNFYTMTVYEKGAEVIRMLRTILGPENYRKGTDLYFERHDGQAVTCDDFVQALEDASGVDLSQFRLWYAQAGTPEIEFKGDHDAESDSYTVTLSQTIPDTPGQKDKKPMFVPVSLALLNDNGDEMELGGDETVKTLYLTDAEQSFTFENIKSEPVPSVLRNFSAPVKLKTQLSDEQLAFLMVHDTDGFNQWEAGQTLMLRVLNQMIDTGADVPASFMDLYSDLLDRAADPQEDKALMARALSIPDIVRIAQERDIVDTDKIYDAREAMLNAIVDRFSDKLLALYDANRTGGDFSISPEAMGKRVLQNTVFLISANKRTEEDGSRGLAHYEASNNMTDRMAALHLACALDGPAHDTIVEDFYKHFKSYPLVVNKWFSAQVAVVRDDTMSILSALRQHADFNIKNPNRVRALYAAFAMNNPVVFHKADGSGYNFLTDAVLELNTLNPQIAARLLTPMREWKRYTPDRQEKMQACLQRILDEPKLSPDVFEIAQKSLKA